MRKTNEQNVFNLYHKNGQIFDQVLERNDHIEVDATVHRSTLSSRSSVCLFKILNLFISNQIMILQIGHRIVWQGDSKTLPWIIIFQLFCKCHSIQLSVTLKVSLQFIVFFYFINGRLKSAMGRFTYLHLKKLNEKQQPKQSTRQSWFLI